MIGVSLTPRDRVLVLGASGWFGRTFLGLLDPQITLMACAGSTRGRYVAWDAHAVQDFSPTVVVNFAFLTRDRISTVGIEQYMNVNSCLTNTFINTAQLPSVRAALTVSSGAAVASTDDVAANPYGALKKHEEDLTLELISESRAMVVARAWSISGPDVQKPHNYAFSDMILQAAAGHILVSSEQPTFRRYVSVRDYLSVCFDSLLRGASGVIDSGGQLIEMGELATRIATVVNLNARVDRVAQVSSAPSVYASDNVTWMKACASAGLRTSTLDEQIRSAAEGLLRRGSPEMQKHRPTTVGTHREEGAHGDERDDRLRPTSAHGE